MKGEPLTGLEIQLAELLAQGLTQREAAEKMFRSHRTIDGYRDSIFEKLGCRTSVHAVSILFRKGVLK